MFSVYNLSKNVMFVFIFAGFLLISAILNINVTIFHLSKHSCWTILADLFYYIPGTAYSSRSDNLTPAKITPL